MATDTPRRQGVGLSAAAEGSVALEWLPRHRLAIPISPPHYCNRFELTLRCAPMTRPVTLLVAPGGFGKTTLLAEVCRRAAAQGVPVAWITLASDDGPAAVDAYLAHTFQAAGLDLLEPLRASGAGPTQPHPRTALLIRVLEAAGRPCVLALDEVDAASPGTVELLNDLLRNAPPCLHVAIACRALPPGLDLSRSVLGVGAEVVTANDLRFSKPDIARFFDLELSRTELAAVAAESDGWPIALRIRRNESARPGAGEDRVARHVMDNWIAGRFWQGFAEHDRECIFDAALLDWFDAALLAHVVELGALQRLLSLPRLAGLLEPAGRATPGVYRLHPLLREHCVERRRLETPERYRRVHSRVAAALASRGETVEAMRHAKLGGDSALAGSILAEAGGLQIWLLEGTDRLAAADRLVAAATSPPLAMTHCVALMISGRLHEARRLFEAAAIHSESPGDEIDRLLASGAMAVNGCRPFAAGETRDFVADVARVAALPNTRDSVRAALSYGLSACSARAARFDASLAFAREARRLAVGRFAYLTMIVDAHLGEVAMARGRVREANSRYRAAQRIARARFLKDPRLGAYAEVLMLELALERNRLPDGIDPRRFAGEEYRGDAPLSHYAARIDVAVELALESGGPDAALTAVDALSERVRRAGLEALDAQLAALRVSVLVEAGRVSEAEGVWRAARLPSANAKCLNLALRGWRETEALACARVRLLAALGHADSAVDLERALTRLAIERGLRRTLMRSLALRVSLAHDAGDPDAAREAAAKYLHLFRVTDYARPLLRAGAAATAALERILDAHPNGPLPSIARRLLAMGAAKVVTAPPLNGQEMVVLRQLATRQDKEIARALGLSPDGVRYHVRNIFRKLNVGRRQDAVRRARALGILPPVR